VTYLIRWLLSRWRQQQRGRRRVPRIQRRRRPLAVHYSPSSKRRGSYAAQLSLRQWKKRLLALKNVGREVLLFGAFVLVLLNLPLVCAGSGPGGKTWVYIQPETSALVFRGGEPLDVPFKSKHNQRWYWNAYVCRAENCPGRHEGERLPIFPGLPANDPKDDGIACPLCRAAGLGKGKPDRDCHAERPPPPED
jgi:hypothetical protein